MHIISISLIASLIKLRIEMTRLEFEEYNNMHFSVLYKFIASIVSMEVISYFKAVFSSIDEHNEMDTSIEYRSCRNFGHYIYSSGCCQIS